MSIEIRADEQVRSPANGGPYNSEILHQLDHIFDSEEFRNAEALKKFLHFVTTQTLEGHADLVKESILGVEVFGRKPDFDGRTDNVVRVQAHQVRRRLKQYYAGAGAQDPIVVEIPKGHYIPRFYWRSHGTSAHAGNDTAHTPVLQEHTGLSSAPHHQAKTSAKRRWFPAWLVGFIGGVIVGYLLHSIASQTQSGVTPTTAAQPARLDKPLSLFWESFLADEFGPTILAYTNPVFLQTDDGVFLKYDGPEAGPTGTRVARGPDLAGFVDPRFLNQAGDISYNQNLTAVGEVQAVHALTRLFTAATARLRVKPSRLLLVKEISDHNVIILGSPYGNDMLQSISGNRDFSFRTGPGEGCPIEIAEPLPGESKSYQARRDSVTGAHRMDYALVSVLPSLRPGRKLVVLAGCWTYGTQAAAQYVTSAAGIRELARNLGEVESSALPSFFQALLKVDIIRGEVSKTSFVAGRVVEADSQ